MAKKGIQFFDSVKLFKVLRGYGINLQDIKLNGLIPLFAFALCRVKQLSLKTSYNRHIVILKQYNLDSMYITYFMWLCIKFSNVV